MAQLVARILKSNNIAHYYDDEWIYVNKDNISSIFPNNSGRYTLVMKSGETFDINMKWERIMYELENE